MLLLSLTRQSCIRAKRAVNVRASLTLWFDGSLSLQGVLGDMPYEPIARRIFQ